MKEVRRQADLSLTLVKNISILYKNGRLGSEKMLA